MKKILALVLSVMMLFGCIGSAEIGQVSIQANVMGQDMADVLLQYGIDEDGTYTFAAAGTVAALALNAIAQANNEAITVQVGDQAYTVTAETLAKVFATVSESTAPGMGEYISTGAWMNDVAAVYPYLMAEVNRFASVAMTSGMINMYEDGSMEINVDLNGLVKLAADYLAAFAADCDAAVEAVTTTQFWSFIGGPDAETVKAYIAYFAQALAQVDPTTLGGEASLQIVINASGSVYVYVSVADSTTTCEAEASVDSECVSVKAGVTDIYGTSASYALTEMLDGSGMNYSFIVVDRNTTVEMFESIVDGVFTVEYSYTTPYENLNKSVEAVLTLSTLELTGTYNDGGVEVTFAGAPVMTEDTIGYQVVLTSGEESHTVAVMVTKTDNGYWFSVLVDEEQYILVEVYVGENDVTVNVSVQGQVLYSVVEHFDQYNFRETVYDGNDQVLLDVGAGVKAMTENGIVVYCIYNGMEFDLTAEVAPSENGIDVAIKLDAVQGEMAMTVATVLASLVQAAAPSAHVVVCDGNEQVLLDVEAGVKAMTENGITVYGIYNGVEFDLTGEETVTENGLDIALQLDAVQGEQAMNVASALISLVMDATANFDKIPGIELTAEQILGLLSSVIG